MEKKTFTTHRAICVVTIDASISDIEKALVDLRDFLDKSLKAAFWRGLGLGIVVFRSAEVDEAVLTKVVDYMANKTTIVQWVASVNPTVNSVVAAHTWMNVDISYILAQVLDTYQIPENERAVLVVQPKGWYKALFHSIGFRQ